MAIVIKKRNIDFSNRGSTSENFRVNVEGITAKDEFIVRIKSESNHPYSGQYFFKGKDIVGKNSIHFRMPESEKYDEVKWSGVKPFKVTLYSERQSMIFLRIAWMKNYKGVTEEDLPKGAGSYVKENLDGGEVYNFLPIGNQYYGFARVQKGKNLRLERLGVSKKTNSISGVTVVLFARNPMTGGEFIVGFYKSATLNRNTVKLPRGVRGTHSYYLFNALKKDSQLIQEDRRIFEMPSDGPGQSNVWYVEEYRNSKFQSEVEKYIANPNAYTIKRKGKKINHSAWQPDAEKRKMVELSAMNLTAEYFTNSGWDVEDVHKENVGWDMEAKKGKQHLLLEVKGLSGEQLAVELSPNEYTGSKKNKFKFRLCIVLNALVSSKRQLFVFYHKEGDWIDTSGLKLSVTEKTGAIFSLT